MHQLYVDHLPAEGAELLLSGEERHYLGRALRARPGEAVRLAAADGSAARAVLKAFEGDAARLSVGAADPDPDELPDLLLELCPPKGAALDEALDMAAQLGVRSVRLARSERTLANLDGAARPDRLARRLREACRQCLRARVPALLEPLPLAAVLAEPGGVRLLMSERGGRPLAGAVPPGADRVRVLVGPEGGFTAAEAQAAQAAGWTAVTLGPRPLRTPTAVAAALAGLRALAGTVRPA